MHEHTQCEHELKYCKICDTVYCEKCNKEWKTPIKYNVWYNSQPVIGDGTINIPSVFNNHIHD